MFDERIGCECGVDGVQESVNACALKRGNSDGCALTGDLRKVLRWNKVQLIEDLDDWFVRDFKLGQDLFYLQLLFRAIGAGGVLNVKQDLCSLHLFQRCAEARHERGRKIADEAYGIGEQDLAPGGKLQLAKFRVEGGEHAGGLEHAGMGECIEEGALSGVGVADERDDGNGDGFAALPLLVADAADGVELRFDVIQAEVNFAAVCFELRFAWTSGSDAAAELRHGATASGEAGQLVLKLCELYLELAFAGPGVAGEDVEDELRTVDDVAGKASFDVAKLGRREVVVEEHQRRVCAGYHGDNLFKFAFADEAGRIGSLTALDESGGDGGAGGPSELFELGTACVEIERGRGVLELILTACEESCRVTGELCGGGELLPFAELSGELDYDEDCEFLLCLRGSELACEQRGFLGRTGLDEASANDLTASAAGGRCVLRCTGKRSLAGQSGLNPGPGLTPPFYGADAAQASYVPG